MRRSTEAGTSPTTHSSTKEFANAVRHQRLLRATACLPCIAIDLRTRYVISTLSARELAVGCHRRQSILTTGKSMGVPLMDHRLQPTAGMWLWRGTRAQEAR